MKIVVDAMGGDNAPFEIIKGSVDALNKHDNMTIVFCGHKEKIEKVLNALKYDSNKVEILHAPDVINNDDIPTKAIKEKTESSLVIAFETLKKDENVIGLVSAGSTGTILAGGFLKIGRIKGVSRPALCPFLPTKKGGYVLVLDCGANVDCKPVNLCHFALMGNEYYKDMFNVEKPRIALLNIGTENHKGNDLCHEVFPMLEKLDINFVGNMEARDVMSGDYDVIITDGFAGNVLLKSTEGALRVVMSEIKKSIKAKFLSKIGSIFLLGAFKDLKKRYDFDSYGGSPFLGCKKLIIKAHGSSKAKSIELSIDKIIDLYNKNLNENIEKVIADAKIEENV